MSTRTPPKTLFLAAFCLLVATTAGIAAARYFFDGPQAPPDDISVLEPARAIPQISLVDDQSQPFGLDQLSGQWSLLFFGFTHCPDICPNTLGMLNAVHASLAQDDNTPPLNIVFVSVDPRRDKPENLRKYVRYFDKDFSGVTGEIDQIKRLTGALYLPFAYTDNADGSYGVEHSAALVLVNPSAKARAYFTPPHTPQKLADDLKAVMQAG